MNNIKVRIATVVVLMLFVVSVILNIIQHNEIKVYDSTNEVEIEAQYQDYYQLWHCDGMLQNEVNAKRILLSDANYNNELRDIISKLWFLERTVNHMDNVYYGMKLNKRPYDSFQNLSLTIQDIRNFYNALNDLLSKETVISVGNKRYLVLKGRLYRGVLLSEKIIRRLEKIRAGVMKMKKNSNSEAWKAVLRENEDFIYLKEYRNEDNELQSINGQLSAEVNQLK